ncbi:hypothetical protein GOP47_0003652 [Adiantum capillus-veneris]|uniref:Uncharacterized protein n=1 Tax=Adiantum capillus-veneris TaxID=13818 RepID=A0A9D4ZM29_ADICA|nr:hypothetical protein GOP47_0003652 [Adiantum capillus-veneris]
MGCFQRQEKGRGCLIIKGGKGNNRIQGGDHSLIKGDHHLEEISIREEGSDLEDGRIQDPRGGELGSAAAVAELAATTTRMESAGLELSRGESTTSKRPKANKEPGSSLIVVESFQDQGVNEVAMDCQSEYDCSKCLQEEVDVLVTTRSKAKLKPPLDWEEQKEIRDGVAEDLMEKDQQQSNLKLKEKGVKKEEKERERMDALFKELTNSCIHFTLYQLFSLVPIFRDRLYTVMRRTKTVPSMKEVQQTV